MSYQGKFSAFRLWDWRLWLWLMVVVGALWPLVTAIAQPIVPGRGAGSGGLSSNDVYAIVIAAGGPTNGISAATATNIVNNNNAASATWATNLNAPRDVSEVLVSHPTTDSVTSYWGFKYSETTNKSSLTLGEADDVGNALAKRGELFLYDPITEINARLSVTNGLFYSEHGLILKDGDSGELRAVINGTHVRIIKPEQHSPAEKIVYWGTPQLAAHAWLVGTTEEGITNGRFSWLFGDTGPSWNLQRTTNASLGLNYSTGSGATNVTSLMSGNSAAAMRAVLSYNIDADRNIVGGTTRGLSVLGTNVHTVVGGNSVEVSSNNVSVGVAGMSGKIRLWDAVESVWITLEANESSLSVPHQITASSGAFVTSVIAASTNIVSGPYSSINGTVFSNNNVTIPGTLGVTGATTMGTLVGTTIAGNGSGLSNAVGIIAGDASVTIVTNANARSFTITAAGGGGGGWTGNPNQFTGGSTTNIKDGVLLTNAINHIADETIFLKDSSGNSLMSWDSDLSYINIYEGLSATEFLGNGALITNLNATSLASGTVNRPVTNSAVQTGDLVATNAAAVNGRLVITAGSTNGLRIDSTNTFLFSPWLTMNGTANNYSNAMIYLSQQGTNSLGQGVAGSMIDLLKQNPPNTTNDVGGDGVTIQFGTNCTGYGIEISHNGNGKGILVTKSTGTGIEVAASSNGKGLMITKTGTANNGIEVSQSTASPGVYSYVFGVGGYAGLFEDLVNNNTASQMLWARSRRSGSTGAALFAEKDPASTYTAGSAIKAYMGLLGSGDAVWIDHQGTNNAIKVTVGATTNRFTVDANGAVKSAGFGAFTNGLSSFASVASVAIDASGWTNIWSTNNAVVVFGGTTVSSWKKRAGALTSTNITYPIFPSGNQTVILQPGQAIVISGTGVTGSADPF